jgi:hypothetical protein
LRSVHVQENFRKSHYISNSTKERAGFLEILSGGLQWFDGIRSNFPEFLDIRNIGARAERTVLQGLNGFLDLAASFFGDLGVSLQTFEKGQEADRSEGSGEFRAGLNDRLFLLFKE